MSEINFVRPPRFRMPTNRFRRRGPKTPSTGFWIRSIFDEVVLSDNSAVTNVIAEDADWSAIAGFSKATILAIHYNLIMSGVASQEVYGMMGVRVADQDALSAGANPIDANNAVDSDWLGVRVWGGNSATSAPLPVLEGIFRSKRIIERGQALQHVMRQEGSVGGSAFVTGWVSCYVRKHVG